jgi:two-component system NtrC family sensor kinase
MPNAVRILVADDSRSVRETVSQIFSEIDGAAVHAVENGGQALKAAVSGEYALFVCDLNMPIMTGSQVLRVLRKQLSSSMLPVIVLTQDGDTEQKVRAFSDGADDYVTKPVEPRELLARSRVQLELRRLHRESLSMQALALHAQKLTTVSQLSASLSHELNTPAQFLSDNVSFLSNAFAQLLAQPAPTAANDARAADFEYLREEIPRSLADMREGVRRVGELVNAIRDFAEADSHRLVSVELTKTIDSVVELLRSHWLGVVDIATHCAPDLGSLRCYPADLKHALWQVIAQAIDDAAGAHPQRVGQVEIWASREAGNVLIRVRGQLLRNELAESRPPRNIETHSLMRVVIEDRHHGELKHEADQPGWLTTVFNLPA